jgi:hypothetical protein
MYVRASHANEGSYKRQTADKNLKKMTTSPYSFKRPTKQLTLEHLKSIKYILTFADQYTERYKFIFDETMGRSAWTVRVEQKYDHLHSTLCHIMGRGPGTDQCDDMQKTLLLISDVNMYITEMIEFVECRVETTRRRDIPYSWNYDHIQLLQMSRWVHRLLGDVVPNSSDDVTQGLSDAIYRHMFQ